MSRKAGFSVLILVGALFLLTGAAEEARRTFPAHSGGRLLLDLDAGGEVQIVGTGGSSISVSYSRSCQPDCAVDFRETDDGLEVSTGFAGRGRNQSSNIQLEIEVPRRFDVELKSMGGGFSMEGVEGHFSGKTAGGELRLHDVHGEADLNTMGGKITLTDSELDGSLETLGGEVLFENVVGDVRGSSMGGNVRYRNVVRRDGDRGSPPRTGGELDESGPETVQISTMGGEIEVERAPEGADLHTMGGNVEVKAARRFVRAVTMGGDIAIEIADGWVEATTMGGNIEVSMDGDGGDMTLTSMSGDVELHVPAGLGMDLDLEIAFTRDSRSDYRIDAPGAPRSTVSAEWDDAHGTPRKYIRSSGAVGGGGPTVKVKTINGNITIEQN